MRLPALSPGASRPALLAVPIIAIALAFSACGGDDGEPGSAQETAPAAEVGTTGGQTAAEEKPEKPKPAAKGTTITTADSQFGEILFDGDDRAIYLFDKEKTSESECYGGCAVAWPPVLTDGDPQSGGGAQAQLLGTTERNDGSTQVTYDGKPLYYYVTDPPGEVFCHNVDEFGGLWLVVQPDGAAVS